MDVEEDFRSKTNSRVKQINCAVIVVRTRDYTSQNMIVRTLKQSLVFVIDLDLLYGYVKLRSHYLWCRFAFQAT